MVGFVYLGTSAGCDDSSSLSAIPPGKEVSAEGVVTPVFEKSSGFSSSGPYVPTVTPLDSPLGSSKGIPSELEAVWEAWALLNREHIDRESFDPEEFEEFVTTDMPDEFEDMYMEEFEEFETFEDAFMEEPEDMEIPEEFEEMEMTEEFEEMEVVEEEFEEMEPMEEEFEEMEVAEEETIDMEVEEEENTMDMEGEDENEEMEVAEDEESMEDTEGTDEEPESEVAEESEPEERTQEVAKNEEEEIGEDDIDAGEVTDGKITILDEAALAREKAEKINDIKETTINFASKHHQFKRLKDGISKYTNWLDEAETRLSELKSLKKDFVLQSKESTHGLVMKT